MDQKSEQTVEPEPTEQTSSEETIPTTDIIPDAESDLSELSSGKAVNWTKEKRERYSRAVIGLREALSVLQSQLEEQSRTTQEAIVKFEELRDELGRARGQLKDQAVTIRKLQVGYGRGMGY